MRINSQNNQFIFNLPQGIITKDVEDKFQILLDKNFIPYNDVIDYINSTIKSISFPGVSYGVVEQKRYHGKNTKFREAGNVNDKFGGELDVTFRSVDSHLNYFIILEICNRFYLQDDENVIQPITIDIIDKDGDLIYTVVLRDVLLTSLSELDLSYSSSDFTEHTFSLQFTYNYIDIEWSIDRDQLVSNNIFDIGQIHDPNDVSGLEREMIKRKKDSYDRIGREKRID